MINKANAQVIMNLEDYEIFSNLLQRIKSAAYIDGMDLDRAVVVVNPHKIEDIVCEMFARELIDYDRNQIQIKWAFIDFD